MHAKRHREAGLSFGWSCRPPGRKLSRPFVLPLTLGLPSFELCHLPLHTTIHPPATEPRNVGSRSSFSQQTLWKNAFFPPWSIARNPVVVGAPLDGSERFQGCYCALDRTECHCLWVVMGASLLLLPLVNYYCLVGRECGSMMCDNIIVKLASTTKVWRRTDGNSIFAQFMGLICLSFQVSRVLPIDNIKYYHIILFERK